MDRKSPSTPPALPLQDFKSRGFKSQGIYLVSAAIQRGKISTREIALLIPKGVEKDRAKFSATIAWLTQVLRSHQVTIVSDKDELTHRLQYPLEDLKLVPIAQKERRETKNMGMPRTSAAIVKSYCQIAGQNITERACLPAQGQEGCLGCSSPFRRCETCRVTVVDVPAVGMCSGCLDKALIQEDEHQPRALDREQRIQCQASKGEIKVAMCEAIQGQEACRNCPAPCRKCEKCKSKAVRFPRYGLCLRCSVEEFGDGWAPSSEPQSIPHTSLSAKRATAPAPRESRAVALSPRPAEEPCGDDLERARTVLGDVLAIIKHDPSFLSEIEALVKQRRARK